MKAGEREDEETKEGRKQMEESKHLKETHYEEARQDQVDCRSNRNNAQPTSPKPGSTMAPL